MNDLYLFDDARSRTFEPFASTRPISPLAAGFGPIWRRGQTALQCFAKGIVASRALADFDEPSTPGVVASGTLKAGSLVAHSRFAPATEVIAWRSDESQSRSKDADAA